MLPSFLKKLILTLVALGLLSSLQAFAATNFDEKKIEITDLSQDEKPLEEENCELENWNFLSYQPIDFKIFKTTISAKHSNDVSFAAYLSSVPTSPPEA